jgi:hypothetical protein
MSPRLFEVLKGLLTRANNKTLQTEQIFHEGIFILLSTYFSYPWLLYRIIILGTAGIFTLESTSQIFLRVSSTGAFVCPKNKY